MNFVKTKIMSLILLCLRLYGIDEYDHRSVITICENGLQEEATSNHFYSLSRYSSCSNSLGLQSLIQVTQWDILRALVKMPKFCASRYNLSSQQVSDLL